MISLSKLNGDNIYINEKWIETLEAFPDTTITFHSGNKIVVLESMATVMDRIREWYLVELPATLKPKQTAKKKKKKA